jgi:hypothetical protein
MLTTGPTRYKPGDRVKILHSIGLQGVIDELRGPLGPKGAQVYSILLPRDPEPMFVEVLEEQLELLPDES